MLANPILDYYGGVYMHVACITPCPGEQHFADIVPFAYRDTIAGLPFDRDSGIFSQQI